jgi:hypothetical protein
MGTAEKSPAHLNPVTDDFAVAMLTDGGHGLDRAFEAIKDMMCACRYYLETFFIIVAANFADCHPDSPSDVKCFRRQRGSMRSQATLNYFPKPDTIVTLRKQE